MDKIMNQFEKDKAQFAKRVRRGLPASLDFARSEFLRRQNEQKQSVAVLEQEINAIRAEAQNTALQLYFLAQDLATGAPKQADDLLLQQKGENL